MEKLNYKLLNFLLVVIIIFLITKLDFYNGFIEAILNILLPIFLGFFIGYSLYPCASFLTFKFSYKTSCFLVLSFSLLCFLLLIYFSVPILLKEIPLITDDIFSFLAKISFNFNDLVSYFTSFLSLKNSLYLLNQGASFFTSFIIVLVLAIYFLFNMPNIKKYLSKYPLFLKIDKDLFNYYKGFYLIIIIEIIEYLVIYFLIGHPYFLLLALLSGITSVIPLLGALLTNLLALISAFSISPTLFFMTAVVMILIPIFNSYLIEPKIYKKTLKISLISIILSCFIFASLFGILGILLAIPLFLIIKNFFLFYFSKPLKM